MVVIFNRFSSAAPLSLPFSVFQLNCVAVSSRSLLSLIPKSFAMEKLVLAKQKKVGRSDESD